MRSSIMTLTVAAGACVATAQPVILFEENWDAVPLINNTEEGLLTGDGGGPQPVWSPDFPAGWTTTFNQVGIGVLEFQGWVVMDPFFWNVTAGDQDRSDFVLAIEGGIAKGNIAVADPDEWDDFDANGLNPDGDGRTFDADLTSPIVSIAGVDAGTLVLQCASSWRDEDTQEVAIEVSYDGGPFVQVLNWTSDPADPRGEASPSSPFGFRDDAPNELLNVALDNPAGAMTAQVRFRMINATNDWWWAIDEIRIAGEGAGLTPAGGPGLIQVSVPTFNSSISPVVTVDADFSTDGFQDSLGAEDYLIEIATDGSFSDVVFSEAVPSAGEYTLTNAANSGLYFVRVTARNGFGGTLGVRSSRFALDNPLVLDRNADGMVNFGDVSRFIADFNAGCQ